MGIEQLAYLWTAIFPLTVLIYYFFRKKFTEKPVSSTLFWEEVMKETKVSPYLQHLQRNALFYLQMLALLLFVFALLNPYYKTKAIAGEQIIWIVDTSASMLAGEDQSLFDQHKEEMEQLTLQLSGKPLTLITTGEQPTVVLRNETDENVIRKAIQSLKVTYEHEQMPKTLDFTQTLFSDQTTTIFLFTDQIDRQDLPVQESVNWVVKGGPAEITNVSINRFGAAKTESGISAIVQIVNNSKEESVGTVAIQEVDGESVVSQQDFTITPGETVTYSFKELPDVDALTAVLDVKDDYLEDNTVSILLQQNVSEVFVDASLHELVRKAFEAMDFPVSTVPTEQISSVRDEAIIVTNQTELLTNGQNVLLIGRNDESSSEISGDISVSENGLFSFALPKDVYVSELYPPFEGYETIASVGEHPFIQVSPEGNIAVLSDVQMTDWPLHPSFPLFLWSAREELSTGGNYIGTFSPNEQRPLAIATAENDGWDIYSLAGEHISTISDGGKFKAPETPGLYMIRSDDEEKRFSVALQQSEKELLPGSSFRIGDASGESIEETVNRSIVPILLLVILLVMAAEWEVQRRRGFTN
ncbi:BatA and WFA domain-containing protein [Chungangia koreensis]|uniref:BatA and WFA domain-containing protein n=1 Tax=Chungangia koreensis TaxID=752657 RepID=A0ABV8X2N8_9LACT